MLRDRWIFVGALAFAITIVVGLLLAPRVEEALAPEPRRALIGLRVPGSDVSEVLSRAVVVPSGSAVTLDAVLEAVRRDGSILYYTDATSLVVDGEEIDRSRLRRWDRPQDVKVRWFTIEPTRTEIEVETLEDFELLRFEENFRSEWPQGWSVPLAVDPRFDDGLDPERRRPPFGTVRLHVRIEVFGPEQKLVPVARFSSTPADRVLVQPDTVPPVIVVLPGALEAASAAFGLTHLALRTTAPDVVARAGELWGQRLAAALPTLLGDELRRNGFDIAAAPWSTIDFVVDELGWGADGILAGDVLRVGARAVFLFGDSNNNGRLDPDDLCLDFERGAALRSLREVFGGGGAVEWLALAPRSAP